MAYWTKSRSLCSIQYPLFQKSNFRNEWASGIQSFPGSVLRWRPLSPWEPRRPADRKTFSLPFFPDPRVCPVRYPFSVVSYEIWSGQLKAIRKSHWGNRPEKLHGHWVKFALTRTFQPSSVEGKWCLWPAAASEGAAAVIPALESILLAHYNYTSRLPPFMCPYDCCV